MVFGKIGPVTNRSPTPKDVLFLRTPDAAQVWGGRVG